MDSSNPAPIRPTTPITPTTPTSYVKRSSSISNGPPPPLDPAILHILSGLLRDLQFLNQQRHLSDLALQEIIDRLPKPASYNVIQSPALLSPTHSPVSVPQVGSPAPSVHSEKSKVDSELGHSEVKNTSIIQPQEQSGIQYLQSQNGTDSQLPSSSIHEQQEHKPEIPYGGTVDQPTTVPETVSRSSTPRHSMSRGPLPPPPNSINNAPLQHPTVPPNFISKQQEAEFYANKSRVPKIHDMLPVYSPQVVEAQWDFNGTDDGDLSFKKGDHIEVTEYVNDDWWRGRVKGKDIIGIFPKVYTKSILQSPQSPRSPDGHQRRTSTNSLTSVSSRLTQQSMNLQQNLQPNLQQNPQQNPLPTNRAQVPVQLQPQQPLNRQVAPQSNLTTPYSYQNYPIPYTSQPNTAYYLQNNQYYNQPTFSGGFSGGSKK